VAHLTDHIPGYHDDHSHTDDVDHFMDLGNLPTAIVQTQADDPGSAVPPVASTSAAAPRGTAKHALVDSEGKIVQWFHHEADVLRNVFHRRRPPTYFALPQKSEISRIQYAKDIFLRRHAPYKDIIVPSGPHSSFFDSLVNMVKCIIGAGMLSLPLAYAWSAPVFLLSFASTCSPHFNPLGPAPC